MKCMKIIFLTFVLCLCAGMILSCEDAQEELHHLYGYVYEGTPGDRTPLNNVHVWMTNSPGDNSADDLETYTNSKGSFSLDIDINRNYCEPLRFWKVEYVEQRYLVCHGDRDEKFRIYLEEAEDVTGEEDCSDFCARMEKCEDIFRSLYEDVDDCVDLCENYCDGQLLTLVFDPDSDKCDEFLAFWEEHCSPPEEDDDDDADDDEGDDDTSED